MRDDQFPIWTTRLQVSRFAIPLEYKYVIVARNRAASEGGIGGASGSLDVQWEDGENRRVGLDALSKAALFVQRDDPYRNSGWDQWRGAGMSLPRGALRSMQDFAVAARWARLAGLRLIRIPPLHPVHSAKQHSSALPLPLCCFAFDPLLLDCSAAAALSDKAILSHSQYQEWRHTNSEWLEPYAWNHCLAAEFGSDDARKWPLRWRKGFHLLPSEPPPEQCGKEHLERYYVVQYRLHLQLLEAAAAAHSRGIVLMVGLSVDVPAGG